MKPSLLTLLLVTATCIAQVPVPLGRRPVPVPEPTSPPARHIREPRTGVSFDLPAGWNFSRQDAELSTFALDARSALPRTEMHSVAQIAFNPFPYSTFSGALFYSSLTPHSTELACSNQATAPVSRPASTASVSGIPFKHGYSEHGGACIESRDEVYTALRGTACYRFDLVINTFCGGEVSGARDMTDPELDAVRHRLETILNTVHLDESKSTETPLRSH